MTLMPVADISGRRSLPRPLAAHAHHLGDGGAGDVGVEDADRVPAAAQFDGKRPGYERLAHASLARKHGDDVFHLGKAVLLELRGSSLAAGGGCMLARSHGTSFHVEPGCGPGERLVCPYCTHHARAERRSLNVVVSHHDVRMDNAQMLGDFGMKMRIVRP